MTAYELAKKFINAKTYIKDVITKRVNTFYMFDQLDDAEYEELITLINEKYSNVA